MKSLAIVDDQPVVRAGVRYLLQNAGDLKLCGEASTAEEAKPLVEKAHPDLLITELSLPDKNGLDLIKDLRVEFPDLRILVLSHHDELLYGERSLKAGASGYVMKNASSSSVVNAIRRVLSGNVYVSTALNNMLIAGMASTQKQAPTLRSLSDRELEVFELIGRGLAPETIAKNLHISVRTIDAHRTNIRKKLGLRDSTAILRYAVRWVESGNQDLPS